MRYPIVEIFQSIQGEGIFMGAYANFIRLGGCNLACHWCDTDYDLKSCTEMTVEEIMENIQDDLSLTVITGGEPTIHNLHPLLAALGELEQILAIETNGTHPVREVYDFAIDHITCSPKPGSGYQIVEGCEPDELKYVVDKNFRTTHIPLRFVGDIPIWLQPESSEMNASIDRAYQMIVKHPELDLRLGVQLHKIYKMR